MPTAFPDLFAALAAQFEAAEVRARTQANRQVQYITARTAMNRLDTVLGPENWWDEYAPSENSVLCRLTIRLPDGTTLTKADAGGYAGMPDQGDDDKSGFSDSFKRAAVKFGVGRYLYRDGVPTFNAVGTEPPNPQKQLPGPEPTSRPGEGAPSQARPPYPSDSGEPRSNGVGKSESGEAKAPKSGRALFAWTKEQEDRHKVGLLKYLNGWAKLQDFPGRMVDWDEEQVKLGHAEAIRKLRSQPQGRGDAYEGD